MLVDYLSEQVCYKCIDCVFLVLFCFCASKHARAHPQDDAFNNSAVRSRPGHATFLLQVLTCFLTSLVSSSLEVLEHTYNSAMLKRWWSPPINTNIRNDTTNASSNEDRNKKTSTQSAGYRFDEIDASGMDWQKAV